MLAVRVAILALVAWAAASPFALGSVSAAQDESCPVTVPAVRKGSGFGPKSFNYGTTKLRAQLNWSHGVLIAGLYPDGGALAPLARDGSMSAKVGWWRGDPGGQLRIKGHRLDAVAPPLRATPGTVASYGHEGFVPSGITFPTDGCWSVTGSVGGASITFVVEVMKPPEGVLVDCSTRAQADFPHAYTSSANLVVGPLVFVGLARTPASVVEEYGGQKSQLLVRNGHRVTLELTPRERRSAGLAYGPLPQGEVHLRDAHRIVAFVACSRRSGSMADGKPVTFWPGFVLASSPRCVRVRVLIDAERTPRRLAIPLGASCTTP